MRWRHSWYRSWWYHTRWHTCVLNKHYLNDQARFFNTRALPVLTIIGLSNKRPYLIRGQNQDLATFKIPRILAKSMDFAKNHGFWQISSLNLGNFQIFNYRLRIHWDTSGVFFLKFAFFSEIHGFYQNPRIFSFLPETSTSKRKTTCLER